MKNKDFKIPNKTNRREYFFLFNTLILESTPLNLDVFRFFDPVIFICLKTFLKKISSDFFAKKINIYQSYHIQPMIAGDHHGMIEA